VTAEIGPRSRFAAAAARLRAARPAARLRRLVAPANAELFYELLRAGIKMGDHHSILGALWSLLAPFVMLVALYLVFRHRFGGEIEAYPLYLLVGISLVNYFVTATRYLIAVLLTHRQLMIDSTVPRETVIASQVAVHTQKLLIEMAICAGFGAWYGRLSLFSLVAALPLLLAFVALTTGVGLVLALLHCFARDIEHVWAMVSRLLLFVTPVFYGLDDLAPFPRLLVTWLNPLTPFLIGLRDAFLGDPLSPLVYAYALAVGVGALLAGYGAFLLLENAAVERA
jgi:ABC-type polysaccharide/polyol phosphate export permease